MKRVKQLVLIFLVVCAYGIYSQVAKAALDDQQSDAASLNVDDVQPEVSTDQSVIQGDDMPDAGAENALNQDSSSQQGDELERDAQQNEPAEGPEKVDTQSAGEEEADANLPSQQMKYDLEKKRQEAIDLVNRGVKALQTMPFDKVASLFSHTKEYIYGDLYLFVYDMKGTCLAHGEDSQLIWKNLIDLKDWVGTPIVKNILEKAKSGGGWVTYGWHNATKVSYIQRVDKDGKSYAIGCGYYPQSKEEAVVNLVKGGVALFNDIKSKNESEDMAFSLMNYPKGQFIAGDLYLYALDFEGNIAAQAERPGLTGSNAWNYRDERGKYVNREIVAKLDTAPEGVWVDYISKRASKRSYAEKVIGKDGKKYFIACGYYPEADRNQVVNLVRSGYHFMKTNGKTSAIESFSSRRSDVYRYGDLFLVVYDMKGKIIAHGDNSDSIGKDQWDLKDQDGNYYVRNIIKRATKEGFWLNAKINGSFESTYAQKIDLGIESFVIVCSYYPVSKPETMTLLVQSAVSFLKDNPREVAFAEFSKSDGRFVRGDLDVVVVDTDGLCYVYGNQFGLVWRNIFSLQDDDGRQFIKLFINKAKHGSGIVDIKLNGSTKINYVLPVEKDGKTYVVSSGYYQ